MSNDKHRASKQAEPSASSSSSDADLAQAFRELVRGEQTAQILESSLTNLESKLDALLASFEARDGDRENQTTATDGGAAPANDEGTREEEDDKMGNK